MTGAKQFLNVWMRAYTDVPKKHTRVPEMDYLKLSIAYTEFETLAHFVGNEAVYNLLCEEGIL